MARRIAVRGIVVNDDGLLFAIRLKPYNEMRAIKETWWCLPGGGLDIGEPLVGGLKREILEELDVEAKIGKLLYVQQFVFNNTEHLEFFFYIKNAGDFENIDLEKSSHGAEEIAEFGFVDATKTNLKPVFLSQEKIVEQIEKDLPVKIFNYF